MKSTLVRNLNKGSSSSISLEKILKDVMTFEKHIRIHQDQRFPSRGNVRIALYVTVSNAVPTFHPVS